MGSADFLSLYRPQAHRFFATKGASTAIALKNGKLHYAVVCDSDAVAAELPETFFGIPIKATRQLRAQLASASGRGGNGGAGFGFRPGIAIRTAEQKSTSTLSCFAQAEGLRLGAVTSLHGVRSEEIGKRHVYFYSGHGGRSIEAELIRGASFHRIGPWYASPDVGLPRRSDVGLFGLPENLRVSFNPDGKHPWKRVATREEIFEYLGKEVLQAGATSGLVYGVVELCELTLTVLAEGEPLTYEGLMGIRGRRRLQGFARPGDSGSVVFTRSGVLLGMILAFAADMTYAIPLVTVLAALQCQPLLDNGGIS
jgi:hypothetical protein